MSPREWRQLIIFLCKPFQDEWQIIANCPVKHKIPDEWQTIANLSGKRPESRTVDSVYVEAVDLVAAHGWIAFERDGSENRNGCSQDYD